MHRKFHFVVLGMLAGLMFMTAACAPAPKAETPAPTAPAAEESKTEPKAMETYTDPFAYCAAVGTVDQPDGRYTGEKTPDSIIQGFIQAAGLQGSSEPADMFKQSTIWRCMNNQVYACNFGANLPCDSKANIDKTPTQAMADYCKENQNSDFIPMYVTGHETIYSWRCVKDAPEVLEQVSTVDAAGYIENIWYALEAGK